MEAIERFKAKLTAIADAIRDKTNTIEAIPFDQIAEKIVELKDGEIPNTIVLVDPSGNEIVAVRTDQEVQITATANDIRLGTTAVTEKGIITGEKEIPSYNTREGYRAVPAGSGFVIPTPTHYDYTKLQAIICPFNTSSTDSVSAEKVVINNNVHDVLTTTILAEVKKDDTNLRIDLGITNESDKPYLIRFFMYKEIY